MASAFGHAALAAGMGSLFEKPTSKFKFILLGIFCSIFPDADVIAFSFGIPYESLWGHRGFTHSIFFALMFALLINWLFYRKTEIFTKNWWILFVYFALCIFSHAFLDALTTGGKGVAFFAPFENSRYFLPWKLIKVSPIGIKNFFTERGWQVIQSELIWIGIPSLLLFGLSFLKKSLFPSSSN